MLTGILRHVESDDEAKLIIKSFMARLPSGSYVAMDDGSDTTDDGSDTTRCKPDAGSENPPHEIDQFRAAGRKP
jgi:hypothetical protein